MQEVGALPVEAFLDALARRDLATMTERLAPDAVLAVPSLRASLTGRSQFAAGVEAVLRAFPDLRYTSRSRYLAPGQVTDEATITGVRLGPWGEVPPSGRPHLLPARVVLEHDGLLVTRLTLWADARSLRALVDDASDRDRTGALPIVTALRALVPAGEQRVFIGSSREAPAPPPVTPTRPVRTDELNPAAAKAAALKVPMPRRVRRTLGVSAAVAMAGAAAVIVGWVARGALTAPVAPVARVTSPAPATSSPAPAASRTPATAPSSAAPAEPFTRTGNLFTLNTDLTFDKDKATLTPEARAALANIVAQVRKERRTGVIRVDGFTDSDGTHAHNMKLSRDRARAVAGVLRQGLRGLRITVVANGYGEARQKAPNDTEAGKALNRRVEITVPGTNG